jgi:hypothetical protein
MRSHTGEKPYKCTIQGCGREYYDKGNLKYHEKTCHTYEVKAYPFTCEHMGCNMKFKTKKQKLIHHHNLEPECKSEKTHMIRLLGLYKKALRDVVTLGNIEKSALESNDTYIKLKECYEELEKKLIDPDIFFITLGDSFDHHILD